MRRLVHSLLVGFLIASHALGANIYVRSGAGGAGTGADWANAYTTINAAATAGAAGDEFDVSEDHAESAASLTSITWPGTEASPNRVLCVNHAGSVPPVSADLATTATVTTTGANNISIPSGRAYVYGIAFSAGSSTSNGNISVGSSSTLNTFAIYENCKFILGGNNASSRINFGATTALIEQRLINPTFKFAHASQGIVNNGPLVIAKGSVDSGGTAPTTLFLAASAQRYIETTATGFDMSFLGSGKNLVDASGAFPYRYFFRDCKLGSSVAIKTGTIAGRGGCEVTLINGDSADTNYRYARHTYDGDILSETTIVRTGGSSDGTTPISRKLTSSANTKFYAPLLGGVVPFWNSTVGSVTVEAEVVTDNVTLKDNEAWIEVWYPGTSGYPLNLASSDAAPDVLNAGTNQTSSSVTWTTTGLTTPIKQTLSTTFTTTKAGPLYARVVLAKPSTTMYVDGLRLSGSGRQYQTWGGYVNEGASSSGVVTGIGMRGGFGN